MKELESFSPLADKNKMASRFVPVADEKIFVLNEAVVSPNMKKATKFTFYRGIKFFKVISNE
jgi:hypothetical protein